MGIFDLLTPKRAAYLERERDRRAIRNTFFQLGAEAQAAQVAQAGGGGHHPIVTLAERHMSGGSGAVHDTTLYVLALMREFVPVVDEAIMLRRVLEGSVYVESTDEALADELNGFANTVPVGYLGGKAAPPGLNTYLDLISESADEAGLSVGEIVIARNGRGIDRLVSPSSRTLYTADNDNDGIFELYQQPTTGPNRAAVRLDNRANVQILSFGTPRLRASSTPWPKPVFWSNTQTAEGLMRITESLLNAWFRFGDPSLLNAIEYDVDARIDTMPVKVGDETVDFPVAAYELKRGLDTLFANRRVGRSGDVTMAITGGRVTSQTLGGTDSGLASLFREHTDKLEGHIVGASHVPVWLFPSMSSTGDGMNSSRAEAQAAICAAAAEKRTERRNQLAKEIFDLYLIVTGRATRVDAYVIKNKTLSILDDEIRARAHQVREQARASAIANIAELYNEDGVRRFTGEAETVATQAGLYPDA